MKHVKDESLVDEFVSQLVTADRKQTKEEAFPPTGAKSGDPNPEFPPSGDKTDIAPEFPPSTDKSGVTGE